MYFDVTIKGLESELEALKTKRAALVESIDKDILNIQESLNYFIEKRIKEQAQQVKTKPVVSSQTPVMPLKDLVRSIIEEQITNFVTAEYVTDKLMVEYFPERNKEDFRAQISNLLSKWKRNIFGQDHQVTSYQYSTSKKDTVWGRKDWLDKDGKPKGTYFISNSNGLAA